MSNDYYPPGPKNSDYVLFCDYNLQCVELNKFEKGTTAGGNEMFVLANLKWPMNVLVEFDRAAYDESQVP